MQAGAMDANEIDKLLRKWRKKPLWSLVGEGARHQSFAFGKDALHNLLPHRSPFLLCEQLNRFADAGLAGSQRGLLCGSAFIDPQDRVFRGHFPGFPVYPGVLQLEMVGQLALCLGYFQKQLASWPRYEPPPRPLVLNILASRVLGAYYLRPVRPGVRAEIQACELGHSDGFFARMLGQLLVGGEVAMVCAQEVCFVDGVASP